MYSKELNVYSSLATMMTGGVGCMFVKPNFAKYKNCQCFGSLKNFS